MEMLFGNLTLSALTVTTTLVVILLTYLKWCFTFWKRRDVYTLPPSLPFGNAANIMLQKEFIGTEFKNVHCAIKQKGLRYGGYYLFGKPIFVPVDLDLVKHIMVKDFDSFTDHMFFVDVEKQPLTGHLFSLKGDEWKRLRNKITPAFTGNKIKMMFQSVMDCAEGLIPEVNRFIAKGESIDMKNLISRFNIDVIGSCSFGIECNSLNNPKAEFALYCTKFFASTVWNGLVKFLAFFSPEIFRYIKVNTIQKDVHDFFLNIVKENVNYREKNGVVRKDFMHSLIELRNNNDVKPNNLEELTNCYSSYQNGNSSETSLTVEEIAAQCFLIFLAGFETSATTLTFCLYELAENLKLQEKVRNEIQDVLKKHGEITYDALMEMPFVEMCINETLRKYPPVSIHTRACTKRYRIPNSDVVLEEGAYVFISALGIHRDPENFPDPERFDPERFSSENKATRHPSAWIPFGDGPRICLGLRFGLVEVKVALAVLLTNYRFKLNKKTKTPLVADPKNPISITAFGGVWLDAEKIAA